MLTHHHRDQGVLAPNMRNQFINMLIGCIDTLSAAPLQCRSTCRIALGILRCANSARLKKNSPVQLLVQAKRPNSGRSVVE